MSSSKTASFTRKPARWLLWSSLLLLLVPLVLIQLLGISGSAILDLQLSFTPEAFTRTYHAWCEHTQQAFAAHFKYDFAFIAGYALFGHVWSQTRLFSAVSPAWLPLARWSLPLAAVPDITENLLEMHLLDLLAAGQALPAALVWLAAACASLKWLLISVFGLLLTYALGRRH